MKLPVSKSDYTNPCGWVNAALRYIRLHVGSFEYYSRKYTESMPSESRGPTVTLSTIPSRIGKIAPTLNSIFDQSMKPRRVFLAIPEFSLREKRRYRIPDVLLDSPVPRIIRSDRDWGPATKLLALLRAGILERDELVVTIDDDNIYPQNFLETIADHARKLPTAALSLRGWHMPASFRWKDARDFKGTQIDQPEKTDVITGCGGIAIRPYFFDESLFDYSRAPKEAFFVDDIWISGHLARKGVPRYVIPSSGPYVYLGSLASLYGPALDAIENGDGFNNDVVIDYFRDFWMGGPPAKKP